MPKAASLAAEIKCEFNVQPKLIEGSGGVFEVKADGRLIFSKAETGRFPEPGEILSALGGTKK
ncbi:MAG: SelT/SelW/SelH family protein [Phycisphaerae bacterium]|nr:SelT/SelW/SelH family protein [Phycisphaerae bacterium]